MTEEGLEEEILQEKDEKHNQELLSPKVELSKEVNEKKKEKIKDLKIELLKNINVAVNEVSLSLDLVSLLLSNTKPNLAKSTISPFLIKTVPSGSLNSDKLDNPNTKEDSKLIGRGWKNESMTKITELFKTKASQLHKQAEEDAKYWAVINQILANGEILIKLRDPIDNSKAIGVKYGYSDSGSNYHNKGIAVLRRTSEGSVEFVPINNVGNYKHLRVRILTKINNEFKVTGKSSFGKFNSNKPLLINDIEMARYFIFEEDLFYNLLREARTLISYNVLILNDKILIEINNKFIEIESVAHDSEQDEQLNGDSDQMCDMILNYLKIMLCGYYKYNLGLKQKVPTNYIKFKRSNSHPLILRPLIGNFKHEYSLSKLLSFVQTLLDPLDHIESKVSVLKYENLKKSITNPFLKSIEKPVSNIIITLKDSKDKYLKINICLTSSEIFVNLIVKLNIIKFECQHDLESNENGVNVLNLSFNDLKSLQEGLAWSVQSFSR